MDYRIIDSGSSGNAVVFNNTVMVDAGVSYKKLAPYLRQLQLVLLTHIHSDHFNRTTIKRLASERPSLRFACCSWLVAPLVECGVHKYNIDVCTPGIRLWYVSCDFVCFELEHDVPNCGYQIRFDKDRSREYETVVYATDTVSLPDLPACDYYFVESNYKNLDELAERVRVKTENGEYVYEKRVAENHMSEEYVLNWLVRNGSPSSRHVFLHEHQDK